MLPKLFDLHAIRVINKILAFLARYIASSEYREIAQNIGSCYARCPNPSLGKEKTSTTVQHTKEGKLIADSSQGPCCNQRTVQSQRALSPSFYTHL